MAKSERARSETAADESSNDHVESRGEVGNSVQKVDGYGLVTGEAAYTDDMPTEHGLEGKILYSPHAHARITAIDTSPAEEMDGVRAVLTHEDFPEERYSRQGVPYPQPAPFDERGIDDKVRFVGDVVAAVAAETEDRAEAALDAIDVEYDVLDAALTPEEAMAEDAPVIHDEDNYENPQVNADLERNVISSIESEEGDVDAALEAADHVVTGEYETQTVQHAQMEMHTSIAWTDDQGRLVLRTSTQTPHLVRDMLARALQLDRTDVKVVKPRVGGAFGAKQDLSPDQIIAAGLALETEDLVRIEIPREKDLQATFRRAPMRFEVRTGVTDDGDITAMDVDITSNAGAFGNHSLTVMSNGGHEPLSIYPTDRRVTGRVTYTNTIPTCAMRGYGSPQGAFAVEGHIDEVAEAIDMDPVELRRRNMAREGDEAFDPPFSDSHRSFEAMGLAECVDRACESVGWEDGPDQPDDDRYRRGYGIALGMHKSGVAGDEFAGAEITLEVDATVTLRVGVADIGQGADTAMAQIAAEILGLPTDDVQVKSDDTDTTPWDNGAYGSSTTYIAGNATQEAARDAAGQVREIAATWTDGDPEEFELADGEVRSPTGESIELGDLLERAFTGELGAKRRVTGTGSYTTDISPHPFAAQLAEVEVDTETGEFEVRQLINAADVGYAIHPENTRGQVIGGAIMGLGQAISEELTFDEDGKPEVGGLRDYKSLRSTEVPENTECILVEPYEPTGPFGAKSVGETANIGPPAAVANAVKDAVGVRIGDLPVTAEKIRQALDDANVD